MTYYRPAATQLSEGRACSFFTKKLKQGFGMLCAYKAYPGSAIDFLNYRLFLL